jgi:methyl-accepting chemotaxis protein
MVPKLRDESAFLRPHMFRHSKQAAEAKAKLDALGKSQAVIEFELDGTIITANEIFLSAVGYAQHEIVGKHHSMFVDPDDADSPEYAEFWDKLRRGEYQAAQYKRLAKGGREFWIEASYNPICRTNGKPYKVVKFATDVTRTKTEYADLLGKINAISKSQAVIEFKLDGTILTANENFLNAVGYTLAEIEGRHHSMFVEPAYKASREYEAFWHNLRCGKFQAGQYKRFGKGQREIWIEASYNPILDLNGEPYKVVKFATDITRQAQLLANLNRLIEQNFAEIDHALGQSNRQTTDASASASETSNNVQMMAAAAEELASSVAEISEAMAKSRAETDSAAAQADTADQATERLTNAATSMGGIIGLIQNIAGQINLLALNATIEAARAGEAGRGFAVVATEVKNLAAQAARATEQIAREIEGIQSISGDVVAALQLIRTSIAALREHVVATASAIEEQSAVTNDMSSGMQSAAQGVTSISRSIGEISAAVMQVSGAVTKTKEAASVLAR